MLQSLLKQTLTQSLIYLSLFHASYAKRSLLSPHLHERALYDTETVHIDPNAPDHNQNFFKFVTRPDIDAPRWDIQKYDDSAIAPGYWFLGPYQSVSQKERGGGWVGPHIYDGDGELIWSGVPTFNGFDVFDFRVQNVLGEDKITCVFRHEHDIIMNSSYEIERELNITERAAELNMHDFNFVDNGTRALLLKTVTKDGIRNKPARQRKGYHGPCKVRHYGFEELDTETFKPVFTWSSEGHVDLEESYVSRAIKHFCRSDEGYDYLHANAIDKFPDGDYLLSGRHCNTIYKISGKDGSIVWRLGGRFSNFKFDDHFSGQHDARVRSQNSTHIIISFLDNAETPRAIPRQTNEYSRGFVLSLRTDRSPMTAEVIEQYEHPHRKFAPGRGSYQALPNGNTFIGWTAYSLHTEYDSNGKLILEAKLKPKLRTYRSYKFPWIGHPTQPPDVHSAAISHQDNSTVTTSVHVSWNGATEVATWSLYKTDPNGKTEELLISTPRRGFETSIICEGYASHIVVEALDRNGKPLGRSNVIKTIPPSDPFNEAVLQEDMWLQDHATNSGITSASDIAAFLSSPIVAIVLGVIGCAIGVLLGVALLRKRSDSTIKSMPLWRRWISPGYERVSEEEEGEESMVAEGEETLVADDEDFKTAKEIELQ